MPAARLDSWNLEGPGDHQIEGGRIGERLVDVVERSRLHRPDRRFHVVVGRDDENWRIAAQGLHFFDDLQAAAIGQHHVQNDERGGGLRCRLERRRGARRGHHLVLWRFYILDLFEVHLQRLEEGKVVVDNEQRLHRLPRKAQRIQRSLAFAPVGAESAPVPLHDAVKRG